MSYYQRKRLFVRLTTYLLILLLSACSYLPGQSVNHPLLTDRIIKQSGSFVKCSPLKTIRYLDSAFNAIKDPGISDLYAKYQFKRTFYADSIKALDSALIYTDKILNLLKSTAESPTYQAKYADELLAKGDILFEQRHFNEAYACYFEGREAIERSKDSAEKAWFYFLFYRRLGDISYGKGSFSAAAGYQKIALKFLAPSKTNAAPDFLTQGSLDNIALSYLMAGQLDSSMVYFDKALQFISKMKPSGQYPLKMLREAEGVILGNRGTAHFQKGQFKLAENDFLNSININKQKGYANEDALITRTKLAELYLRLGRIKAADFQVKLIANDAFKKSSPLVQQEFMLLKADYEVAIGHNSTSNLLLKKYISTADSMKNVNKTLFATDFSNEFQLLKKQRDLNLLNLKSEWRGIYLAVSAVIGLFGCIVIYLIVINGRNAKLSAKISAAHNCQLEITLSALEKSNREKAQLMGIVAHDLKNPISAIHGISNLMLDDERSLEDKELLALIKTSSEHLNQLVQDILSAKLDNNTFQATLAKENLRELIKDSVDLLQYRANEKDQKIILHDLSDVNVLVNKEVIWRVVNNLIVNAIKFSPAKTSINVSWKAQDEMVIVCIEDQGIGVPNELREKIFQLATEARRIGTFGEQTFGLGLYISRQLIEEQGGRIWLTDKTDQGSVFCFSLLLAS